jgi:hypothetical protein
MLILVGVPSFPDDAVGRVECKSPRRTTSAMITVRPPRVMFAVPVMALRRETLLPESFPKRYLVPIQKFHWATAYGNPRDLNSMKLYIEK